VTHTHKLNPNQREFKVCCFQVWDSWTENWGR